ncbi:MAG: thiamine-phosphate kinase, partial [Pseudomonadota bacterium]
TALGPGDDCALLAPSAGMELAVTTDMLVAGTHFFADTDPYQLGWKTLAVNLSDLAAMGAQPRWVLLAGALPNADEAWVAAFARGLFACAERYSVDVVGGDTTRGPLNLCLTALGEVPNGQALRRDGALAGDDLWLSGYPGLAALSLAEQRGLIELDAPLAQRCRLALQQPIPRVELGLMLRRHHLAHAAIDISDGLLADLDHLLERSALAARLYLAQLPALPAAVDPARARQCQLAGGDDYELLFTAAPEQRAAINALAEQLQLPLWRCGELHNSLPSRCTVVDVNGQDVPINYRGFDHFG